MTVDHPWVYRPIEGLDPHQAAETALVQKRVMQVRYEVWR